MLSDAPQIGAVQANPGLNVNALRPYKGFGPIRETFNDANSSYNALQVELSRRFKNGLSYGVAYTYSIFKMANVTLEKRLMW